MESSSRVVFEVYESLDLDGASGSARSLCYSCDEFVDAVEFALARVAELDPLRSGRVQSLEIERASGASGEVVWTYAAEEARRGEVDLIRVWGFDVTRRWIGPGEYRRRT